MSHEITSYQQKCLKFTINTSNITRILNSLGFRIKIIQMESMIFDHWRGVGGVKIYSAAEREPNELIFIGEKKTFCK